MLVTRRLEDEWQVVEGILQLGIVRVNLVDEEGNRLIIQVAPDRPSYQLCISTILLGLELGGTPNSCPSSKLADAYLGCRKPEHSLSRRLESNTSRRLSESPRAWPTREKGRNGEASGYHEAWPQADEVELKG